MNVNYRVRKVEASSLRERWHGQKFSQRGNTRLLWLTTYTPSALESNANERDARVGGVGLHFEEGDCQRHEPWIATDLIWPGFHRSDTRPAWSSSVWSFGCHHPIIGGKMRKNEVRGSRARVDASARGCVKLMMRKQRRRGVDTPQGDDGFARAETKGRTDRIIIHNATRGRNSRDDVRATRNFYCRIRVRQV